MVVETKVPQEHAAAQEQSSRVSLELALDIEADVTAAGLEDSDVTAHVAAGDETRTANKSGTNVGQNATVKVRHNHDIELLRTRHGLHGGVVDNHVVDLEGRVLLGSLVEGGAEQTIGELHDVGLVNASNLLAAVGEGESKSESGNALRLGAGDDLERLNDTGDALVLEAGVLALGVLTDNAQVDVLVAGLVAGHVLDEGDAGVDVELLSHGNVEALVAGAADGGVEDSLEAELVALERRNTLTEGRLSAGTALLNAGDGNLLPLDGDIVGLEDRLDRLSDLSTDAVTGDQRNGVLAAKLGRLEDVGLDSSEGSSELGLLGSAAQHL